MTAFHIGAPSGIKERVDNPVLTDVYGNPIIPGSSLKGLIRSCAERSAKTLGLKACALFYPSEDGKLANSQYCATTRTDKEKKKFNEEIQKGEDALRSLKEHLCDTCKLFGSPFQVSKVRFPDPILIGESWVNRLERRDGVGINRDSNLAVDGVKYDFEVVPVGVRYAFEAEGEDLDENDLPLLGAVLLEMAHGSLSLGGKKSRGLGRFRLENLEVATVDLNNEHDFFLFLRGEREKFSWIEGEKFFEPIISKKFPKMLQDASKK